MGVYFKMGVELVKVEPYEENEAKSNSGEMHVQRWFLFPSRILLSFL